jgi:hypothetical protein
MPISDAVSRTIKCDAPECDKTVTFDPQIPDQVIALPDWIRTTRTVQLGNRASFTYCSDICEVKGVTTGSHNVPEPKQVAEATAADQKAAEAATDTINKLRTPVAGKTPKKISLK